MSTRTPNSETYSQMSMDEQEELLENIRQGETEEVREFLGEYNFDLPENYEFRVLEGELEQRVEGRKQGREDFLKERMAIYSLTAGLLCSQVYLTLYPQMKSVYEPVTADPTTGMLASAGLGGLTTWAILSQYLEENSYS